MDISEIFGSKVFNESVMRERLPKDTYNALKSTIHESKPLDIHLANTIASAMKDWAIENGATHYTHWFQPLTGITAEKHDSFIEPTDHGHVILEFKGKELIKGESDASSFPSGGLRATFEARGYTAWDPTSYAFIKDDTLCIPTAFCSYTGEALDEKTPLLRSMDALNNQALRILRLFGDTQSKRINTTVGAEQEYFLIDKEYFNKRLDLLFCGRTLFGAPAPKGQELDDHYFGALKPRVSEFMKELDEELWKLGVLSKTKHNEAAPAQHELAPIFSTANIAVDHNQITMELLKKVAEKHGLVCLLHEKPFSYVNGSGKHNNWAMSTDTGVNLLDPGNTPDRNAQFLLFLSAVIEAVDKYQGIIRASVASAGNDHRLGGNEAPPAIISIFLGNELTAILEAVEGSSDYVSESAGSMELGVDALPVFPKDSTDRNRTSPFAFTGNKFEFRMLGSSASVADCNIVINSAVAQVLKGYADELEKAEDFKSAINELVKRTIKNHKRIIFNGNGYSDEWKEEAAKRGLLELKTTPEALEMFVKPEAIKMFADQKVFTEAEVISRYDILMENYCKIVNIEAKTMVHMTLTQYLPAISEYSALLSTNLIAKKNACPEADLSVEKDIITKLSVLNKNIFNEIGLISSYLGEVSKIQTFLKSAKYYKDTIIPSLEKLRSFVDSAELIVANDFWPTPSYSDLMFRI